MKHKRLGDNRGLILPLALMAFVVLGALAAAILSIGGSEAQIASNHLRAIQAQFLAEAGLEHAFNSLRTTQSYVTNAQTYLQDIVSNSSLGGAGSYTVQYQKAGTYTFRVVSTGASAIVGGSQQIRRAIMSTAFSSNDAVLTNGKLTIQGHAHIQGQCPNAHSNYDPHNDSDPALEVKGNATVDGTATATGITTVSGSGSVGSAASNTPSQTTPDINPADFLAIAKASLPSDHVYQMKANGDVLRGDGSLREHLNSNDTSACGWKYTAGSLAEWKFNSGTLCNGTFYFEGSAEVEGNPGSTSTPWVTTLIATGNIIISGNPTIQTDNTHNTDCGSNCYTVKDTVLVAGIDAKISGNPTVSSGMIAAHEQVGITGNATITGFVIAQDAGNSSTGKVGSDNETGSTTITYDCGGNPPLQVPLHFLSWGL